MKIKKLPFKDTGFFSNTIIDYLGEEATITPFCQQFPSIDSFKAQIELKTNVDISSRKVLVDVLKKQYKNIPTSSVTQENIDALLSERTFTIVTGHQLNLFSGPLYFLYKIISTINLCEELSEKIPDKHFVPVYWMASEDHDFEEINFFNFKGKKVQWNTHQTGGVGRFKTEGLAEVLALFSKHLGASKNAKYLIELFRKAYLEHSDLASATRYLANELFGEYGLVIVDADEVALKQLFVPQILRELKEQVAYKQVIETNKKLEKHYKIQVNPREINLFYLTDNIRERIVLEDGMYKVINTEISWDWEALKKHVKEHPERFSPNVIFRPLYQETILPNLGYIGGGGELAYWFQLKSFFDKVGVPFPLLILRNSVQVISEKQENKLYRMDIDMQTLFKKKNNLIKEKVIENAAVSMNFDAYKQQLNERFKKLKETAKKTDVSFIGAVNAQEKKQLKGIEKLEKRLLRAEKRRQEDLVTRISLLHEEIFPNQGLEERQRNFSEYYLAYGRNFIEYLKGNLYPLEGRFTVLVLAS